MKPINHSFATSLTLAFCSGLALSFLQGCSLLGGAMICGSPQHVEARNEYLANGGTNPEYPPCTCGEYEWLEYATKCEGEEQPCNPGGNQGGGETGGEGQVDGGQEPEECQPEELSCVDGPLLCTDIACVCNATSEQLIAGFGDVQVAQWMSAGQMGTTQGTCDLPLYKYSCLFDGVENSKVYHGNGNQSHEMLEFECAACMNRVQAIDSFFGLDTQMLAYPSHYIFKGGYGSHRTIPVCGSANLTNGWPSLRPSYSQHRKIMVRPLDSQGNPHGNLLGHRVCRNTEVSLTTTEQDGPTCHGLIDCSLFCGGDTDWKVPIILDT